MADRKPFDPKSTTFTNLALDEIMPRVSPNAWRIICVALRKTQGWADADSPTGRKQSDVIAVSQFMKAAGIASRSTATDAIAECLAAGYLTRQPAGDSFRYSLNLSYTLPDVKEEPVPVQKMHQYGNCTSTETVLDDAIRHTETVLVPSTETVHTNTNLFNTNANNTNITVVEKHHVPDSVKAVVERGKKLKVAVPLIEMQHAFQRGVGQNETKSAPKGKSLDALREMVDEGYLASDVEIYARTLKAGWWADKVLTLSHVAERIGQWIANGRPGEVSAPSITGKRIIKVRDEDGTIREVEAK
jgi:hypothetical protein